MSQPEDLSAPGREWLAVGFVCKPHGVHGDLLVEILTDFPERLADGVSFGLGGEEGPRETHEVHHVRYHKGHWLLSVKGLRSRDEIEGWRGQYLFLTEQALEELPPGYVYEHELVGMTCLSPDGTPLGEVVGFDSGAEQSRLVVRRERREFLVPYVPAIVRGVDAAARTVTLDPPPGLLDDDSVTA